MNLIQTIANIIGGAGLLGTAFALGRGYQMLRDLRNDFVTMKPQLQALSNDVTALKTVFLGVDRRGVRRER